MFQKMKNRKGFTLIEMLVVIAIIAVLVAIIIPTVSSATTKATAAANAANLRALKAEITTAYLTNDQSRWTFNNDGTVTATTGGGADTNIFKDTNGTEASAFAATWTADGDIEVKWEDQTVADWADIAGGNVGDDEE